MGYGEVLCSSSLKKKYSKEVVEIKKKSRRKNLTHDYFMPNAEL